MNISIWENGKVIYANPGFYKDLGLVPGDLESLVRVTTEDDYIEIHPDDFPENEKELLQIKERLLKGEVFHREVRMKTLNRSSFHWYNTYVVKGRHKGAEITIEMDEDIDGKAKILERLNEAIKEKEVLLKEVHHRVKNNFQIISSLLRLQQKNIKDEDLRAMLLDSENRVRSMSMIHESLYKSSDVANVDFGDYIKDLVRSLVDAFGGRTRLVKFKIDAQNCNIGVDSAIPCSLIINELVSNSFKHGYDDSVVPEMQISLKQNGREFELQVRDNGVGFPDSFFEKRPDSMGIMLVTTLASQLNGMAEFKNNNGAEVRVVFVSD
jgi:two-component sensor histidine kinase